MVHAAIPRATINTEWHALPTSWGSRCSLANVGHLEPLRRIFLQTCFFFLAPVLCFFFSECVVPKATML